MMVAGRRRSSTACFVLLCAHSIRSHLEMNVLRMHLPFSRLTSYFPTLWATPPTQQPKKHTQHSHAIILPSRVQWYATICKIYINQNPHPKRSRGNCRAFSQTVRARAQQLISDSGGRLFSMSETCDVWVRHISLCGCCVCCSPLCERHHSRRCNNIKSVASSKDEPHHNNNNNHSRGHSTTIIYSRPNKEERPRTTHANTQNSRSISTKRWSAP